MQKFKKILWAIDPFADETKPDARSQAFLRKWMFEGATMIQLQPAFVCSIDASARYTLEAREAINRYLSSLEIFNCLTPQILFEESGSVFRAAERLVQYAEGNQCSAIMVSSHGRRGVARWIMGSFAERLLTLTKLPILFLSSKNQEATHFAQRKVLFATDLSPNSKQALDLFFKDFSETEIETILYHNSRVNLVPTTDVAFAGASNALPDDYFEKIKSATDAQIAHLKAWLRNRTGVENEVIVEPDELEIGKGVLKEAAVQNVDLIVLASQSRPAEAFFFGSVARDVIRNQTLPVLVYGPLSFSTDLQYPTFPMRGVTVNPAL